MPGEGRIRLLRPSPPRRLGTSPPFPPRSGRLRSLFPLPTLDGCGPNPLGRDIPARVFDRSPAQSTKDTASFFPPPGSLQIRLDGPYVRFAPPPPFLDRPAFRCHPVTYDVRPLNILPWATGPLWAAVLNGMVFSLGKAVLRSQEIQFRRSVASPCTRPLRSPFVPARGVNA